MADLGYYRAVLATALGKALPAASIVSGATAGRSARVISRCRPRHARLRKQARGALNAPGGTAWIEALDLFVAPFLEKAQATRGLGQ